MDQELRNVLKKIIKDELGDMISDELAVRFKPLQEAIDTVQKSNDQIAEQIKEDRKDINQIKIDIAKGTTQNKIIIDNQNEQVEELVEAVKEEAQKIPKHTEKAVEAMFNKQPFLKKIRDRFLK